jgi:arylsulfatase I/J
MISSKLKQAGYATHYTGKWDAGSATMQHLPINRGFDTGFGYLQHANDYWQYTISCEKTGVYDLWNNTTPGRGDTNPKSCSQSNQTSCEYEDNRFVEHVLSELDAHDPTQPLFYYWAMHNIHAPLEVPQSYYEKFSFINDTERRYYAAMVNHMDDMVALVVAKLKAKGMWDNTLIVLTSDNGGPVYAGGGANNYPLKGGKMSNWEGGIRVNAFVSGGYVPQAVRGTKLEAFVTIEDWYATFCALAGVDPTDYAAIQANLPPIDSYNLWPLLTGTNTTNPRTEIPIGEDGADPTGVNVVVQAPALPSPNQLLARTPLP